MNKAKVYRFKNPIFPRDLYVVVTSSPEFLNEHFQSLENDESFSEEDFTSSAAMVFRCMLKKSKIYAVCAVFPTKKNMDVRNMAHEGLHIAICIQKDCQMSMGYNNGEDETCAYLTGWGAYCINKVKTNKIEKDEEVHIL